MGSGSSSNPSGAAKRAKVKAAAQRAMAATTRPSGSSQSSHPVFLDVEDVLLIHEEQLLRYAAGPPGSATPACWSPR
jgi:hypothetical protein